MNEASSTPKMDASTLIRGEQAGARSSVLTSHMGPALKLAALFDELLDAVAPTPWIGHAGASNAQRIHRLILPSEARGPNGGGSLYTREERARRDASPWTVVQAVLAPVQFFAFAISLILMMRYIITGDGYQAATISIIIKTILLYTIMVTGSIWEKHIFGKWLFASPFFWEDVFSILVLLLQTAYLIGLITGWATARQQMFIAMAAYATYVINATQFLLKLRAARLDVTQSNKPVDRHNRQMA